MSNNLDLQQIATNQSNKEVSMNTATGQLDAALTEYFIADVTAGNVTLTNTQYRRCAVLIVLGATTAGRTVTLPAIKKSIKIIADAANTQTVDIKRGSATVVLGVGGRTICYTDGSTNGLVEIISNSGANIQSLLNGISSTRGTILYRNATVWTALAPGTTGDVLTTGGVGADPSWTTPGGGGGGGGGSAFATSCISSGSWNSSSTAYATKGLGFMLHKAINLHRIFVLYGSINGGEILRVGVYSTNGVLKQIQSIVGTANITVANTSERGNFVTFGTPLALAANTPYVIAVTGTTLASTTTSLQLYSSGTCSAPYFSGLPLSFNGNLTDYPGLDLVMASLNPGVGDTFTAGNLNRGFFFNVEYSH